MNELFWLTIAVTAFVFYHLGQFVTLRNLKSAADKLIEQMHQDNQTGNPIGESLAREMGIEL